MNEKKNATQIIIRASESEWTVIKSQWKKKHTHSRSEIERKFIKWENLSAQNWIVSIYGVLPNENSTKAPQSWVDKSVK